MITCITDIFQIMKFSYAFARCSVHKLQYYLGKCPIHVDN